MPRRKAPQDPIPDPAPEPDSDAQPPEPTDLDEGVPQTPDPDEVVDDPGIIVASDVASESSEVPADVLPAPPEARLLPVVGLHLHLFLTVGQDCWIAGLGPEGLPGLTGEGSTALDALIGLTTNMAASEVNDVGLVNAYRVIAPGEPVRGSDEFTFRGVAQKPRITGEPGSDELSWAVRSIGSDLNPVYLELRRRAGQDLHVTLAPVQPRLPMPTVPPPAPAEQLPMFREEGESAAAEAPRTWQCDACGMIQPEADLVEGACMACGQVVHEVSPPESGPVEEAPPAEAPQDADAPPATETEVADSMATDPETEGDEPDETGGPWDDETEGAAGD